MRRQRIIGIIFFTICLKPLCIAQQSADQIIKQRIADRKIPGIAFVVARDGEIIDEGYSGLANVELNVPLTEKSVFAIASMSKTYTAAATLLLAERGLLQLDNFVKEYIPEAPKSWDAMTIRHLLTHTSGLVDDWELYSWDESNEFFLRTQNDSSFLQHLFDQELKFEPGTNSRYSCGPFVLGVVIERVTGQSYGDYLKEFIFEPLNLNNTFIDHPYKIIPNRVSGYFDYDKTEMNAGVTGIGNGILISPVSYGRADVGIRTTAKDLVAFYDALLTGKLLNEESTRLMFSPAKLDNGDLVPTGPGWMNWPLVGRMVSEHSGAFRTGFSSQAFVIPKEKFIVILLSNMSGGTNFSLAQKIASAYYPELVQISKRGLVADDKPNLTASHLELFTSLANEEMRIDLLSTAYPKSYLSPRLKKAMADTDSIVFLNEEKVSDKKIKLFGSQIHYLRFYKLIGDKTYYTTVSLDNEHKIVFIDYPGTE